jgi:hypothetical protein
MQSLHGCGAHSDCVWQLHWLDRGLDSEEVLMSASADGRLSQWSTSQVLMPMLCGLIPWILCMHVPLLVQHLHESLGPWHNLFSEIAPCLQVHLLEM